MKKLLMFYFDECPHCQKAMRLEEELKKTNPEFAKINIERINEKKEPDLAAKYDYYYVPTYYIDGVKVSEGKDSKDDILKVLKAAL